MHKSSSDISQNSICKFKLSYLSFFAVGGLFIGCKFALLHSTVYPLIFPLPSLTRNMIFVSIFPFLLAAIALYLGNFRLLNFFVFLRMFSFGFSTIFIISQPNGWYIRFMAMFAQTMLLPLYLFFIFRTIQGRPQLPKRILFCLISIVLVLSLNLLI